MKTKQTVEITGTTIELTKKEAACLRLFLERISPVFFQEKVKEACQDYLIKFPLAENEICPFFNNLFSSLEKEEYMFEFGIVNTLQ